MMAALQPAFDIIVAILGGLAGLGGLIAGLAALRRVQREIPLREREAEVKEREATVQADRLRLDSLDQVIDNLNADYKRLIERYQALDAAREELERKVRTLTTENAQLRSNLDRISREHRSLVVRYNRILRWAEENGYCPPDLPALGPDG
jgi:chromosome segregation ATPase